MKNGKNSELSVTRAQILNFFYHNMNFSIFFLQISRQNKIKNIKGENKNQNFHLWAVTSVSMNRKPSNLGLNFSFRAARSAGERPPWFLPKTRTRVSVSRSHKKTRTLVLWVSDPQGLRRNLNEDGVEFAALSGLKPRTWRGSCDDDEAETAEAAAATEAARRMDFFIIACLAVKKI